MSFDFLIKCAATPEERREVYRLRYRVLVEELHQQIEGANAEEGFFTPIDAYSLPFLAYEGDTPAGTLTVTRWADGPLEEERITSYRLAPFAKRFSQASICVLRSGAIAPQYRKSPLSMQLVAAATFGAATPSLQFVFLECGPHLIPFYERFGWRRYAPPFPHQALGLAVPMCFVLGDHEHLQRINSPVREVFQEHFAPNPEAAAFFARYRDGGRLDPHCRSLLRGVSGEEWARLLASGERVRFQRKGLLPGGEPLLLLDGYLEVSGATQALRGPGALLEDGGAEALALTDGEALRIPRSQLTLCAMPLSLAPGILLR